MTNERIIIVAAILGLLTCLFYYGDCEAQPLKGDVTGTAAIDTNEGPPPAAPVVEKTPQQIAQETLRANIGALTCNRQHVETLPIRVVDNIVKSDRLGILSVVSIPVYMKDTVVHTTTSYKTQLLGVKSPDPDKVKSKAAGVKSAQFATDWIKAHDADLGAFVFGSNRGNLLVHICDATTGACLNKALVDTENAEAFCSK